MALGYGGIVGGHQNSVGIHVQQLVRWFPIKLHGLLIPDVFEWLHGSQWQAGPA